MAVIWTKTIKEKHFEVRRAGRSVRLYTNGVFHSQYNPATPVTGTVWNLLVLPALFRPAGAVERVLILGVGGGAVIRLLHDLIRPAQIIAVELDPIHLYVARRFFGITQHRAELVESDAVDWLHGHKGDKFDLIIDDLFGESEGEPVRTVEACRAWLETLSQNLSDDGVLVMNFVGPHTLREANRTMQQAIPTRFASNFRLSLPGYENAVGAWLSQPAEAYELRHALRLASVSCGTSLRGLPYRIRRISP